jgi:NADPH2:quinone reductase
LALGAYSAINYKTTDFVQAVKQIAPGGVNVILDMVAGSYDARELECLADDGRLVIIALQGGSKSEINAGWVLKRRLTITGSTLRARSSEFKSAIATALRQRVWPLLEAGRIKPVVHSTFSALSGGAAQAHALMESGEHVGKIVLTW